MQALKDTDAYILTEFRAEAETLKSAFASGLFPTRDERKARLNTMLAPFLKRLADNGWSERDRILALIEVYETI